MILFNHMSVIVHLGLVLALTVSALAQRGANPLASAAPSPPQATAAIVSAAQAVIATLDDAGRAKVQLSFEGPQKTRDGRTFRPASSNDRDFEWRSHPGAT